MRKGKQWVQDRAEEAVGQVRSGRTVNKAGQAVRESRDYLRDKAEQAGNKVNELTRSGGSRRGGDN